VIVIRSVRCASAAWSIFMTDDDRKRAAVGAPCPVTRELGVQYGAVSCGADWQLGQVGRVGTARHLK
jgi:hypothetical protein